MNKDQIMARVKEILEEETGDAAGGSGHLGYKSISDIIIDDVIETSGIIKVTVTYTVDTISEFTVVEETREKDPYDPYNVRKTKIIEIKTQ